MLFRSLPSSDNPNNKENLGVGETAVPTGTLRAIENTSAYLDEIDKNPLGGFSVQEVGLSASQTVLKTV